MKFFLVLVFSLFVTGIYAQDKDIKVDSLSFCGYKYVVPGGCVAESEYQVKCDNYRMVWLYMPKEMLPSMPDNLIDKMAKEMKGFKKEKISCYILAEKAEGYKITFKNKKERLHQVIVYGVVNKQPVMIQLALDKEPKRNNDLPIFPGSIISFEK